MNYEEFIKYIQEHLLEAYKTVRMTKETDIDRLPDVDDNTEVVVKKVVKNNGILLDGIYPLHLKEMLKQANMQAVGFTDLLSDNIYYYDRDSDEVRIYEFAEDNPA